MHTAASPIVLTFNPFECLLTRSRYYRSHRVYSSRVLDRQQHTQSNNHFGFDIQCFQSKLDDKYCKKCEDEGKIPSKVSGSMDEWVQSTFGPSGFDWPAERCAALSAALAEEELVTAVSVAKMDDGDVDDIIQNAGLKKGSAQNFKEGHAALQKAI